MVAALAEPLALLQASPGPNPNPNPSTNPSPNPSPNRSRSRSPHQAALEELGLSCSEAELRAMLLEAGSLPHPNYSRYYPVCSKQALVALESSKREASVLTPSPYTTPEP